MSFFLARDGASSSSECVPWHLLAGNGAGFSDASAVWFL
jgi:hypothetical protein